MPMMANTVEQDS